MESPSIKKTKRMDGIILNYCQALGEVFAGKMVTRLEWNNKDIFLIAVDNQLRIHKEDSILYPNIPTYGDYLGEDWVVI